MDAITMYIYHELKRQEYARKIINMPTEYVKQINLLSIKSVKQKIYTEI